MLPVIDQPFPHDVMPLPDHDEHAREDFTVALKLYATEHLYPYDELVYEKRAKPKFIKEHGREPENCDEVHHLMMDDPYTQFWSGLAVTLQDTNWYNQGRVAERQIERLETEAKKKGQKPIGSLTVDPSFKMPAYIDAVDIHRMPGGYQTTLSDDDVLQGAVYDRGAYYYTKGMVGRWGQGGGTALLMAVQEKYPDLKPKRILDVGCAIGWSTSPFVQAYPDAEVYGIDVGAAILRYGHARAEALGNKIHFLQMSGDDIKFPDGHFDLVVSGGVFHETSNKGAKNMIAEMHRVLAPGGVCMNYDIPCGEEYNLHAQFMLNWDCYYNAEPFWRQWTGWNRTDFMANGGFNREAVFESWADRDHHGNFRMNDLPFDENHTSARGGIGRVHFFGARKQRDFLWGVSKAEL